VIKYTCGGYAKWLERRYNHMHDILRESPAYQWILDEGEEKGIAKGLQQGLQQGLRQSAINIVVARFPELELLAKAKILTLDNQEHLQHLIIDLSIAHSKEEIERVLHAL
jgi:predicted transposase YdaD